MNLVRKIKKMFSGHRIVTLMYHRIGNVDIDPWQLAVSSEHFDEQLRMIKEAYEVISIKELVHQVNERNIPKKAVCITFDDGYADNFLNAAPVLKKHNCLANFYIATGFTGQTKLFWWDVLTEIFLVTNQLPATLQLGNLHFTLENNGLLTGSQLAKHKNWKWPDSPPTQRCAIYLAVWEYLKPLPNNELTKIISFLISWSGTTFQSSAGDIPMNEDQLKELSSNKLFFLGVHTVNHPALGLQPATIQQEELEVSRDYLYHRFDNYTDTVAYPYGHYGADTLSIMKNGNFEAGFTTEERAININADIYRLGRYQVKNIPGDELMHQLSTWFQS